ncbi:MAG: hypothetical protein KA821_14155 [Chitinophagaceae bacterium]|nr:hypothetical protein [Chitinophagaceae bacterium]
MSFFERLSNGWKIAMNSFKVLNANKQLVLFPILSSISLILVIGSFVVGALAINGWNGDFLDENQNPILQYAILFVFYVINYFIIVFFNMALIHCTRLYFRGEQVSLSEGIRFSMSRIGVIFSWAVFAGVVGTILKAIQENSGIVGKIITGIIGIVWGVATFFVVPVIAYENKGPLQAFKRSSQLMREKWGESLAGNFSLGLIQFIGILVVGVVLFMLGYIIHPMVGIALAILGCFIVTAIISAAQTIFVSAVYHNITNEPTVHFSQQLIDGLFQEKPKD